MQDLAGDADNPIVLDDGDEAQDGYAYGVQGEEGAAEDEEGERLCAGSALV